jgi:trimethylamine:corrinoid methyltransferase-like protein
MLLNLASAEMMYHYGIPHCGTSGCGSGWRTDLKGSGMLWMNHLLSAAGKSGMVPFVGANFDSLVFSPMTVVYSDEIIKQVRSFSMGIELFNNETVFNRIKDAMYAGSFLTAEETLNYYLENDITMQGLWPSYSLDQWQNSGSPEAVELLRKRTVDILDQQKPPEDHDEIIEKGESYIQSISP